jgi:hypothetical protein
VVIACLNILEEHTASIFRVIELIQVDAEMVGWSKVYLKFGLYDICRFQKQSLSGPYPMGDAKIVYFCEAYSGQCYVMCFCNENQLLSLIYVVIQPLHVLAASVV